jgi:hypothetical protein
VIRRPSITAADRKRGGYTEIRHRFFRYDNHLIPPSALRRWTHVSN